MYPFLSFFLSFFLLTSSLQGQSIIEKNSDSGFHLRYDVNTNVYTATYTGCEWCRLGGASNVITCNCQRDCYSKGDCVNKCNYLQGTQWYNWCLSDCCSSECKHSLPPSPIRTPVGFSIFLVADWANLGFDPRTSSNNREVSSEFRVLDSGATVSWSVPSPWPDVHSQKNVCYGISVLIFYNDGSRCLHSDWMCSIKG